MTTLQIIPKWKDKTAKFKGTIAAGEHVAVSIVNIGEDGYEYIQAEDLANLRLRVVNPANGKTLAQFPMPVAEGDDGDSGDGGDAWDAENITPLTCELNLNTDRMLMAVPPGANVPLLFVLDAYEGATDEDEGEFTLYFKDMCEVTHWPRRRGEDEPTRLDDYKDIIADFREDIYGEGGFKERVESAEANAASAANAAQSAAQSASAANTGAWAAANAAQVSSTSAWDAATAATGAATDAASAKTDAIAARTAAEVAQTAAETAQGKAEDAQAAAETARDAINEPTDDFTKEGVAVDAKAVGDALDLKADKATTYTKTQTDTKIADAISAVKDSAPEAFDTLKEIADWIRDDQSGAAAMAGTISSHTSQLSQLSQNKVDKVAGKGLSTNDYTTAEKEKLSGVETGAKDNVVEAASASVFPQAGVVGKIYVAKDENKTYRWSGTQYVQVGGGGVVPPSTDPADAGKAADAKATGDALVPMLLAQYYPDGNVKSAAELTSDIKYTFISNATGRTATVKPFCYTESAENDNSGLAGRVVIPPFVDGQGTPYLIDDGTRYKVVAVGGGIPFGPSNELTAIVAPATVATVGEYAFGSCEALASVSLPAAMAIGNAAFSSCYMLASVLIPAAESIGDSAFYNCNSLASVSLPAATTIYDGAFAICTSLASVSLPAAESIGLSVFGGCGYLASVDFGATPRATVPTLGRTAFSDVPDSCKMIVPDAQYAAWTAASGWSDLVQAGYQFLRHSEWEYVRRYELPTKPEDIGAASTNDVHLTPVYGGNGERFSAWTFSNSGSYTITGPVQMSSDPSSEWIYELHYSDEKYPPAETFASEELARAATTQTYVGIVTATRTENPVIGYTLGDQTTKPLQPQGNYAPAANIAKTALASDVQTSLGKADTAVQPADLASAVRYDLPADAIAISSASSEEVEGETVTYGEATLADRTGNRVEVTAAIDELRLTFPAAVSGKVRDFGLRVEIGTGSAALAAPALVPIAPTGETIKIENNAKEIPALADGTATAKGVTLLYFSENAPGVFVVKGEQVEEVA